MKVCDIIFCALGFYAIGFFIASLIWAIFRWVSGRPATETWWKRLYLISAFSWLAVISFILIGVEVIVVGIGLTIEDKAKGSDEEEIEDVNREEEEV